MSYLNKNSLSPYLYTQEVTNPVLIEDKLFIVFENLLTKYQNHLSLEGLTFDWLDFVSFSKYEGFLGISYSNAVLGNTVKVRGNGNIYTVSILIKGYETSLTYDTNLWNFTFTGVSPEYKNNTPQIKDVQFNNDFASVVSMFQSILYGFSYLVETIDYIQYPQTKFLPEMYYEQPNSIPVMAEKILTTIVNDVETFRINSWSDIKTLQQEFKFDELFGSDNPIYNIVEPSLLKGLFAIKGSEDGLRFLLKYFDIEVLVYYADEIRELQLADNLAEEVTECDIMIDLTLGKNLALGVNPVTGQIDDNFAEIKFKSLVTKVMSVCLNILAFLYKKKFQDSWIDVDENGIRKNNNRWESENSTEEEVETYPNQYSPYFYAVCAPIAMDATQGSPSTLITYAGSGAVASDCDFNPSQYFSETWCDSILDYYDTGNATAVSAEYLAGEHGLVASQTARSWFSGVDTYHSTIEITILFSDSTSLEHTESVETNLRLQWTPKAGEGFTAEDDNSDTQIEAGQPYKDFTNSEELNLIQEESFVVNALVADENKFVEGSPYPLNSNYAVPVGINIISSIYEPIQVHSIDNYKNVSDSEIQNSHTETVESSVPELTKIRADDSRWVAEEFGINANDDYPDKTEFNIFQFIADEDRIILNPAEFASPYNLQDYTKKALNPDKIYAISYADESETAHSVDDYENAQSESSTDENHLIEDQYTPNTQLDDSLLTNSSISSDSSTGIDFFSAETNYEVYENFLVRNDFPTASDTNYAKPSNDSNVLYAIPYQQGVNSYFKYTVET